MTVSELIALATEAKTHAYAPYSSFSVGAALECEDGSVFTGCNVESASYPCAICAERVALGAAVAAGNRRFQRLAITSSGEDFCYPCGICRQNLIEFSPDLQIIAVSGTTGEHKEISLSELLPFSFTSDNLKQL